MKFCMALMRKILDKQVENPVEEKIIIMSQVYFTLKKWTISNRLYHIAKTFLE